MVSGKNGPSLCDIFVSFPSGTRGDACKKNVFVIGLFILLKPRLGQMGRMRIVVGYSFLQDENLNSNKKNVFIRMLSILFGLRSARSSKPIYLHVKIYSSSHILQDWASGLVTT